MDLILHEMATIDTRRPVPINSTNVLKLVVTRYNLSLSLALALKYKKIPMLITFKEISKS